MNEELPVGWSCRHLQDLSEILVSNVDKKSCVDEPIVRLCNYMDVYKNSYIRENLDYMFATAKPREIEKFTLKYEDVLITKDSETPDDIAVPAYVTQDMDNVLCGYHLALIRPKLKNLSGAYLFHFFNLPSTQRYFYRLANGSTRYGLNKDTIETAVVPIPPLPEQKKIAAILTSVDDVIENAQAQIAKLQDLKKATMNELLTKGIGHTEFKDSELGRIPKSWEVEKLADHLTLTSGKAKPTNLLAQQPTRTHRIAVYGGNGITGYTDSYLLGRATIVIGRVGEYCGCVAKTQKLSWVTDNALYIKHLAPSFDLDFLFTLLDFSNLAKLRSKGGQPLISQKPIMELQVAIPSLEEQKKIGSVLAAIDRNRLDISAKLDNVKALKKALMNDLLTGKVRVNVN